jgi:UDP-N-acetyl-D-glucosamine dehydrogenase
MKQISIFGLGYVGLPLACLCAKKGYSVYGVDVDEDKINLINEGKSPIKDKSIENDIKKLKGILKVTTNGYAAVKDSDIVIVCVPTPIDKINKPNMQFVKSAMQTISKGLKRGQLIILESTVAPGTTETVVKNILEKSSYKEGMDFYLAHCPERIDPGNKDWPLESLPRVVGALSTEGTRKAKEFYESILDADVQVLSSARAAEATKIVENTFRDINIAFVNEIAKFFDMFDIDVMEVLKGASTKPFGFMTFYPGCGVGGHCIPVDPYYLIHTAEINGFAHRFLSLSREINNSMPEYTVERMISAFNELGKNVSDSVITILGIAYKGGVDDLRGSPALRIHSLLEEMETSIKIFDPYVPEKSTVNSIESAVDGSDCVLILTDHPEFKNLDMIYLKKKGVSIVIDGKNILDKESAKNAGLIYRGIGRGN